MCQFSSLSCLCQPQVSFTFTACIAVSIGMSNRLIVEEDFIVSNVGELNQTFLTGTNSGSLCLTIEMSPDHLVEETEVFQVVLSSTDEAVNITNGSALITIEDANEGKSLVS